MWDVIMPLISEETAPSNSEDDNKETQNLGQTLLRAYLT